MNAALELVPSFAKVLLGLSGGENIAVELVFHRIGGEVFDDHGRLLTLTR